jgi:hypothetical protein
MWDTIIDKVFPRLPRAIIISLGTVAAIVFIVGFSFHGFDFVKHGFSQAPAVTMANVATKEDFADLKAKVTNIETNHFGHLKNYLGILNGVLLDNDIINNETKARLDAELSGM